MKLFASLRIFTAALFAIAALLLVSITGHAAPPAKAVKDTRPSWTFAPSWESLQHYECPEWFRDAKFGIWAHWTAQCVPEEGDWYARKMYIEGDPDYKYHVAHYGHPSKVGFKDIDHMWKAEHWNPEKLMDLYVRAGAKYFVALANHHDNFDCWDSKYQPWNSVKIGPQKDLVGLWAKAARRRGLRFGVTVHASRAWSWFEVAQGSDKSGPLKGIPYDGKLTKADGQGQWWEGLDPQDLYAQNHTPGKKLEWMWDASKGSSIPDQAYCEKFLNRTIDLVDKYRPDLLYFDDTVLPFYPINNVGLRIAEHYYNASQKWHNGRNEAVINGKKLDEMQRRCLVYDIERGKTAEIEPFPWQTDTCIGSWHYNRNIFEQHKYKTAESVIHMLADIVSKNGNLLLNIPVKGDGTIDTDEQAVLEDLARWMKVNSEAIFGTRPWRVYGEGPSTREAQERGHFGGVSDTRKQPYTAEDIRFTAKGNTVYAILLGWPGQRTVTLQSLATGGQAPKIKRVSLLGSKTKLKWKQGANGLEVAFPAAKPCASAFALKIEG